jgi:MFS transporter, DHA2 family, multidrug resistance protein
VAFGAAVFIAQYLQLVVGLSPLEAGLWSLPGAGGFIAGSLLTPVLVRHVRSVFAMAGGLALAAAGFGLLTRVDADSALAVLVTASFVFSPSASPRCSPWPPT